MILQIIKPVAEGAKLGVTVGTAIAVAEPVYKLTCKGLDEAGKGIDHGIRTVRSIFNI
jgi:hypothetical protein